MSQPAKLLITGRILSGHESDFAFWHTRHTIQASKFPGFLALDFIPSDQLDGPWVIITRFTTPDMLSDWRHSPARTILLSELTHLLQRDSLQESLSFFTSDFPLARGRGLQLTCGE